MSREDLSHERPQKPAQAQTHGQTGPQEVKSELSGLVQQASTAIANREISGNWAERDPRVWEVLSGKNAFEEPTIENITLAEQVERTKQELDLLFKDAFADNPDLNGVEVRLNTSPKETWRGSDIGSLRPSVSAKYGDGEKGLEIRIINSPDGPLVSTTLSVNGEEKARLRTISGMESIANPQARNIVDLIAHSKKATELYEQYTQELHRHVDQNKFGLSPEQSDRAREIATSAYKEARQSQMNGTKPPEIALLSVGTVNSTLTNLAGFRKNGIRPDDIQDDDLRKLAQSIEHKIYQFSNGRFFNFELAFQNAKEPATGQDSLHLVLRPKK